jgi:hypothetical protein
MSEAACEDDAVRAFETLREEVASLRQDIERVYRQGQEARGVDYRLTLGEMAKTLQELQQRLAAIEGKPALQMTPAVYNNQIMAAGRLAADVADRHLCRAAEAQSAATRELQGVTSRARQAREQRQLNAAFAFMGLCFGMALWYVLPTVLPSGAGDWLAASLIGGSPWYAGEALMQRASPQSFDKMVQLYNACGDEPVELCAATIAVKTLKITGNDGQAASPLPPTAVAPARSRQAPRK